MSPICTDHNQRTKETPQRQRAAFTGALRSFLAVREYGIPKFKHRMQFAIGEGTLLDVTKKSTTKRVDPLLFYTESGMAQGWKSSIKI